MSNHPNVMTGFQKRNRSGQLVPAYKIICSCGNEKLVIDSGNMQRDSATKCYRCVQNDRKGSKLYRGYRVANFNRIKDKGIYRGYEWDLTIDNLMDVADDQNRVCALSGVPLEFNGVGRTSVTASLDRIDNSKGYIHGNVQWVHKDVNRMRNIFSVDQFVEICKRVVAWHEKKEREQIE